jgi:hypothetical protein
MFASLPDGFHISFGIPETFLSPEKPCSVGAAALFLSNLAFPSVQGHIGAANGFASAGSAPKTEGILQVLKIYRFRILKSTKSRFGKMVVPLFWGPTLSFGCAASWCPTLVNGQSDKSIDALMCFSLKLDPAALFNCPKTIFELTSGTGSIA